jgi:hypothetical protein
LQFKELEILRLNGLLPDVRSNSLINSDIATAILDSYFLSWVDHDQVLAHLRLIRVLQDNENSFYVDVSILAVPLKDESLPITVQACDLLYIVYA